MGYILMSILIKLRRVVMSVTYTFLCDIIFQTNNNVYVNASYYLQ